MTGRTVGLGDWKLGDERAPRLSGGSAGLKGRDEGLWFESHNPFNSRFLSVPKYVDTFLEDWLANDRVSSFADRKAYCPKCRYLSPATGCRYYIDVPDKSESLGRITHPLWFYLYWN